MAKKKRIPQSISMALMLRPKGRTENASQTGTVKASGARKCSTLSAEKRDNVLLDQHLHAVCHRLEQSERADAVGAKTILHPAQYFALHDRGQGKAAAEDRHEGGDGEHHRDEGLDGRRESFPPAGAAIKIKIWSREFMG